MPDGDPTHRRLELFVGRHAGGGGGIALIRHRRKPMGILACCAAPFPYFGGRTATAFGGAGQVPLRSLAGRAVESRAGRFLTPAFPIARPTVLALLYALSK